jgi:hypothetical protein
MAQGPWQQRADHRNKLILSLPVELKANAAPCRCGDRSIASRTNATGLVSIRAARSARADTNAVLGSVGALRLELPSSRSHMTDSGNQETLAITQNRHSPGPRGVDVFLARTGRRRRLSPACRGSQQRLMPSGHLAQMICKIASCSFAATSSIGETGFEPATARPPAGCATRLRHSP